MKKSILWISLSSLFINILFSMEIKSKNNPIVNLLVALPGNNSNLKEIGSNKINHDKQEKNNYQKLILLSAAGGVFLVGSCFSLIRYKNSIKLINSNEILSFLKKSFVELEKNTSLKTFSIDPTILVSVFRLCLLFGKNRSNELGLLKDINTEEKEGRSSKAEKLLNEIESEKSLDNQINELGSPKDINTEDKGVIDLQIVSEKYTSDGIAALRNQRDQLNNDNEKLRTRVFDLLNQKSRLKAKINSLKDEMRSIESKMDYIKDIGYYPIFSWSEYPAKPEKLLNEIESEESLNNEINELKNHKKILIDRQKQSEIDIEILNNEIDDLNKTIKTKRAIITRKNYQKYTLE